MTAQRNDGFFAPVSGFDLPRFAGIPTFMRLPHVPFDHARFGEVEIGLIGAPWDGGTTNRPGPRHGPRQLRDLSTMIRAMNGARNTWFCGAWMRNGFHEDGFASAMRIARRVLPERV